MTQSVITFTGNASGKGKLIIPGSCLLEDLYTHPNCPEIIKETLEKHVSWQMRCETPLYRGLNLKNQYLQFRAAMAVFGVEDVEEDETLEIEIGDIYTGFSMVRPTPTHTPIVGAFVSAKFTEGTVTEYSAALTGIEKRQVTIVDAPSIIGKQLTDQTIKEFAKTVSDQYPGFEDFNSSTEYRKAMIAVSLERAFQEVKNG